jgi:threonine dehydratase
MTIREDLEQARTRLHGVVRRTPCAASFALSRLHGGDVRLKLENLQVTGSFKARGAGNLLRHLVEVDPSAHVVAASAGNHAQGVALHAGALGLAATIVMPLHAPVVKVSATRASGARVVLHGTSYDDAFAEATRIARDEQATLVHPFDDPHVIAGQATVALEILEQFPEARRIVVPVGGGGLLAGTILAVRERSPRVEVVAVESAAAPSLAAALAAGRPVPVELGSTMADGIRVRQVGALPFSIARDAITACVSVDDEALSLAILHLLEIEKTVAEAAGAAGVASMLAGAVPADGVPTAIIVSGGNVDMNLLGRVIDHGLYTSKRTMRLRARVPDVPGKLAEVLNAVAAVGANVLEVHHDRAIGADLPGRILIELVVETRDAEHAAEVERALAALGFQTGGASFVP